MSEILNDEFFTDRKDDELAASALSGDHAALNSLIKMHQDWIYNIALRMTGSPDDAEDVTQEIFIKILTRLSTFKGGSSFRTWLYRIAVNYVINMKKKRREYVFSSFEKHAQLVDGGIPDLDPPDPRNSPAEVNLLVEETKQSCLMGMLLCLDRKERLVFILGAVLCVGSHTGGALMKITPENFRKRLSRARKNLGSYMDEKCGLMNSVNPCRCEGKAAGALEAGYIDHRNLQFNRRHLEKARSLAAEYAGDMGDITELRADTLFRDQPLLEPPDIARAIEGMLGRGAYKKILDFPQEAP